MFSPIRFTAAALAVLAMLSACSNNDKNPAGPAKPDAPLGFSATATGSGTVRITFSGRSGESYEISRAPGSSSSFTVITTIPTLSADGTQTYDDTGLNATTAYQYEAVAIKSGERSDPTTPSTTTTFALGYASRRHHP